MARSTRRFFLPAVLVILVTLVSAGQFAAPVDVRAVFDPNGPAFDPLSTFDTSDTPASVPQPPRLLAGTNSHSLPASAVSRNGYCLDVNVDGITPHASFQVPQANLGFRLFAENPINPSDPAVFEVPIPTSGTYVNGFVSGAGVASLNAGSGSTADDVYCVVAYAQPGYRLLTIEWHYDGPGGSDQVISIDDIPIRNVTLRKVGDGLVGAPAEVCTEGWDEGFLTGAQSNAGGLAGVEPDPVNVLDVPPAGPPFPDWVLTGGNNTTVEYVRQVGPEWCAGIGSTTAESGVGVTFNFHAVYNRVDIGLRDQDVDDQPASASLPPDQLIKIANVVELRHVTMDGNVPPRQRSEPKVIGSLHYICLIGTDAADTLPANGIIFQPEAPPQAPSPSGVTVFHKAAGDNPRLGGVKDGTLCFSYTSGTPGEESVNVTYLEGGTTASTVAFDTDRDGNGISDRPSGPLITSWNVIDGTVLSTGGSPTTGVVTFQTINVPLQFNLADGTFIGSASITEWVLGSHTTGGVLKKDQLLDGALLKATITGTCGFFEVPDQSKPKTITGISIGGRFELNNFTGNPFGAAFGDTDATPDNLQISTLNTGGCSGQSQTRIEVEVYYPGNTGTQAAPLEWVNLTFSFIPASKTPRVAWVGQFVTITYAISSNQSCTGQRIHFVRSSGQPGAFVAGSGITLDGPDHAITDFGQGCSASVRYESEDPGEVDIEVFIEGNPVSKVAFPIFYLVFEDLALESTPDQFVSTFGDATANVRGYFVGTNPSGRPAEVKPDGRTVPADRWILPNDWELLKGESNLRNNWGSVEMPTAIITFFMQDEGVINNYKAKIKHGAAGFFIPDDPTDFSFNVNPHTRASTVLGTPSRPRMMSQPSDGAGQASVDTFGDRNLSYEGCAPNRINGNPHCKPEDIAGTTRYYAVAEYPEPSTRGKFPAVASNVDDTTWRWAGYKDVTVVNTDSPQIKYVVAHLRDRDGFCDAANFNNTLGVPVRFEIDAGGGTIIEAADQPYTINGTRRFATATSFDTTDAQDRPVNTHIAKPPLIAEQPDECQAWIKVTNSLMAPMNVQVTFPAPPSPVPGDVRIVDLKCDGAETITVKNFGSSLVNLAGFGIESAGSQSGVAEQVDLIGLLAPGQEATFAGGPGAPLFNWIGTQSEVFSGANDFASLTWEDFPLSTVFCDGTRIDQAPPASFPPDGEGEIVIDIVVNFGNETQVPLIAGWNLVPTGTGTIAIAEAFAGFEDRISAVYVWDATLGEWTRWIPGAPSGVNTIETVGNGVVMWVLVKQPFTLTLPK